jgi:hypothetical protein
MGSALITRGRLVQANQVVLDQADFFQADGFTRVVGLIPSDLVSHIFYNNVAQPWPLISGVGVTDALVVSGNIYFNEVPGNPGFYNIRFRPNMLGYWRNTLAYTVGKQLLAQDFDVKESVSVTSGGLQASFVGTGDCGCCPQS